MADEFTINHKSGDTLYNCLRNAAGKVLDGTVNPYHSTNSWVDWNTANVDDYDLTVVDKGGDHYVGSMPSGTLRITDAGIYKVQPFLQLGDNPADGDDFVGGGLIFWNGSAEEHIMDKAAKILMNKAVQNKATGAIEYYDDDGETVILTHTPADGESEITRTPS